MRGWTSEKIDAIFVSIGTRLRELGDGDEDNDRIGQWFQSFQTVVSIRRQSIDNKNKSLDM